MTVFHVLDAAEISLPLHGLVELRDLETTEKLLIEADEIRPRYAQAVQGYLVRGQPPLHRLRRPLFHGRDAHADARGAGQAGESCFEVCMPLAFFSLLLIHDAARLAASPPSRCRSFFTFFSPAAAGAGISLADVFPRIDPRLSAKRKIHEWLILLLRCLFIALLILALLRPLLGTKGSGGNVARLVLIDNSGSMAAPTAAAGSLETGPGRARDGEAVAAAHPGDSTAVQLMMPDPTATLAAQI